ncbi:MAG: hypothetical protein WBA83_07845 [Burkholderiaceae bacterium]
MTTINYLTTIQFDFGAVKLLPAKLERLDIRPLLVTDKGVHAAGLLTRIIGKVAILIASSTSRLKQPTCSPDLQGNPS